MNILETFDVIPDAEDENLHPLLIKEGKFAGVKYKYGRVWFPDDQPDMLSFEYDLLEGSVPIAEQDKEEFSKYMGDVIIAMLRKQLGIPEESDEN